MEEVREGLDFRGRLVREGLDCRRLVREGLDFRRLVREGLNFKRLVREGLDRPGFKQAV